MWSLRNPTVGTCKNDVLTKDDWRLIRFSVSEIASETTVVVFGQCQRKKNKIKNKQGTTVYQWAKDVSGKIRIRHEIGDKINNPAG